MRARLYCPLPLRSGVVIELPQHAAHHAARVLRLRAGDTITLFTGEGGEFEAELMSVETRAVLARVGDEHAVERESPLAVTLVQGLASAERMDWIVQKAVELGIAAIAPVATARSVARLDAARAARREAHWRSIMVSSCEQCGRNRVPVLRPLCDLAQHLALASDATLRLLLAPDAQVTLCAVAPPDGTVELLVGPEGGLAPDELASAQRAGFRGARLGPRILRTETAALAAMSAMSCLWGDWR